MRVPGISGQQELENIQEKDTTFPREAKEQGEDVCVWGGGRSNAVSCYLIKKKKVCVNWLIVNWLEDEVEWTESTSKHL